MFKLPSLQTLKIFEYTAKFNSFTQAAHELRISQGAISQHIKNLEIRVGFKVFYREGRRVSLTPSGHELLVSVNYNLHQIQRTIELEKLKINKNEIVVSVFPGFAIRWLLPRLMTFNERYPDIKITLNTVSRPLDFNLNHAHAGISYGPTESRLQAQPALFKEHIFPVCSPSFIQEHKLKLPLKKNKLQNILSLPLLSDESPTPVTFEDTWEYWNSHFGLSHIKNKIPRQSQSNITLQLAELGHGIAIGRTALVMDAMNKGTLSAITQERLINPCSYYLVDNPVMPTNSALKSFANWLSEASLEIENWQSPNI